MKMHLSNRYASLKWLEGGELKHISGLNLYKKPKSIILVKDYGNTILIEMEFPSLSWNGDKNQSVCIRRMIPKALLAIEEVMLVCAASGEPIYGSFISGRISDAEAFAEFVWR